MKHDDLGWPVADRCPSCGVLGGHGLVHERHGNGGGHNRPCPESDGSGS